MKTVIDIPATRIEQISSHTSPFDAEAIRAQFPILQTCVQGRPLIYLDNGATTQKPRQVIDALVTYFESQNANIHRGVYALSQIATAMYEEARRKVARFLHARDEHEILFTRGTTEGINLVANCWGREFLKAGDEVIVSAMEHHSNIVPWQMACRKTGAKLHVIPMNDAGELLLDEYVKMLSERTKVVSVVHLSNSLGTINNIKRITAMAHAVGAKVMADGAQWVAHYPTDVQDLDVDFYAFSGHKLYGPTGIGALYGRRELLEQMPPYQGGGDMIESVTFEETVFAGLPNKFEAGTPDIAGAIGLGAAIDFVQSIGLEQAAEHEDALLTYATAQLETVPGLRIIGTAQQKGSVASFVLESPAIAPFDIGSALDRENIAVRTGHHCCQPVMNRLNISATTRASFAMYNTRSDVDALVTALRQLVSKHAKRSAVVGRSSDEAVEYPKASASSPAAAADDLAADLEVMGDAQSRSQYVLELGSKVPPHFEMLKRVSPRIPGCMSEVYVVTRRCPEDHGTIEFIADANAEIVRGLIAVLQRLFSGQRVQSVLEFDIESFLKRIGLDQFISSQRRNGLAGMIGRIRQDAATIAAIVSKG